MSGNDERVTLLKISSNTELIDMNIILRKTGPHMYIYKVMMNGHMNLWYSLMPVRELFVYGKVVYTIPFIHTPTFEDVEELGPNMVVVVNSS